MDRNTDALIDVQAVAAEVFGTLDTGRQIEPFSSRISSFNLEDAYRVTAAVRKMRETRGELPVGRKIGFTKREGMVLDHGCATNVMGGPLSALRHLVDLLARDQVNPPLAADEIVTTGTLTRALPISAGETWTTELSGVGLDGISVRFA
jgi:2-keto-4-pentenoate hydratase